MRIFRFSYIIPRVILLFLLLLATEIGSGYLLRWGLISGGESSVGAKVDIGSVKSSLLETRVLVRDIAVANPRSPMKNLFAADRVEVDFDSHALLRKKLIADYGIVSGLEIGSPRETSGALPGQDTAEGDDTSAPSWAKPLARQYADAWMTSLENRLNTDIHQQFESVRLAEQLSQQWPDRYKHLEAEARLVRDEVKLFEEQVKTAKKNPLRHVEFIGQIPDRVGQLRTKLTKLQAELTALPQQLAADRAAIEAARQHDEQLIREQLELGNVNAKELTNYLLGEQITGPLNETIGWIRWARDFVPPRGQVAKTPPNRGVDFTFPGCEQLPDMLVKAVRLDGTARVGGQAVDLVGVVRDWTNQPELHTTPTTLEVTAKGGLPLAMKATFDRTQDTPRDEVYGTTTDLMLPQLALGKRDKLQMQLAPSRADITLHLHLVGDTLQGNVVVAQRGVQLTPAVTGGALGERLQSALASSVAGIEEARTTIHLAGTLDDPEFDFDSTLGTAVAQAVNNAAADVVAGERQRLLAKSQQQVDAQLAKLNSEFTAFQEKLATQLQGPGDVLANVLGGAGLPQTEVGKLPFGQLFK